MFFDPNKQKGRLVDGFLTVAQRVPILSSVPPQQNKLNKFIFQPAGLAPAAVFLVSAPLQPERHEFIVTNIWLWPGPS